MSEARKFGKEFGLICGKLGNKAEVFAKKFVIESARSVILKSPVDTGRFRGNWQFGFDTPNLSTGSAPDKNGSAAIGTITAKVNAGSLIGKTAWITNNLPYAVRLEYGYSNQTPQGMVRVTIAERDQYLKTALEAFRK